MKMRFLTAGVLIAAFAAPLAATPSFAAGTPCVVRVCTEWIGYNDGKGNSVNQCNKYQDKLQANCKPIALDKTIVLPGVPQQIRKGNLARP